MNHAISVACDLILLFVFNLDNKVHIYELQYNNYKWRVVNIT